MLQSTRKVKVEGIGAIQLNPRLTPYCARKERFHRLLDRGLFPGHLDLGLCPGVGDSHFSLFEIRRRGRNGPSLSADRRVLAVLFRRFRLRAAVAVSSRCAFRLCASSYAHCAKSFSAVGVNGNVPNTLYLGGPNEKHQKRGCPYGRRSSRRTECQRWRPWRCRSTRARRSRSSSVLPPAVFTTGGRDYWRASCPNICRAIRK